MFAKFSRILCLISAALMLVPGELVLALEEGRVIVVSPKVGEVIDRDERDLYGLFRASSNFISAVILQLPDSSYVAEIREETDGGRQVRTLPIDKATLDGLREVIDGPVQRPLDVKARQLTAQDYFKIQNKVREANKQATILMREKWTRERWRHESRYDRGMSYRTTGGLLGFTIGAAAGMLVGKGLQGRKTKEQIIHERTRTEQGEWGDTYSITEYSTECVYSYKNKHAPIYGAVIGGLAGGFAGYCLSKNSDKKYYILVPIDIRTLETESSALRPCIGLATLGPIMGAITGYALYTPMSSRSDWAETPKVGEEKKFDWGLCIGGYLAGTMLGGGIISGYTERAEHKRLWERSLLWEEALEEKPESSLDIQLVPLDPTAFSFQPRRLPNGEIVYEYRWNLVQARF